ncbi:hypothetical protein DRN69_07920 [Candidatus Pacearchaeota archaeon]|mgnify:CR=1 FL=1|nr:MAG: hypothetical protein DRN69_07920 [Candidatus Pacearchaeota archaeon]
MQFRIPFTFSSPEVLKNKVKHFSKLFARGRHEKLKEYLRNLDVNLSPAEYLGICFRTFLFNFFIILIIATSILGLLKIKNFYVYGLGISLLFSFFVFFNQRNYPRVYNLKKTRDIEKNLMPALQDMLVQLESGVPIFEILVNISNAGYGFISYEFKKAVREINSGISHIDALEHLVKRNSSPYFKRVLWQLSNGLRSGSDMGIVIKDSINNLAKEQAIQIQSYGSKLNPLVMFYMLATVILPSLGLTFLTIIASMLGLSGKLIQLLFVAIFVFVVLIQIMFLGLIKMRRPSLL